MSGEKYVNYTYTPPYDAAREARKLNARNKRRATQLLKELENTVKECKERGADKYASEELEKIKTLRDSLKLNIEAEKYTEAAAREGEVKLQCEAIDNRIVSGIQEEKKAAEDQRKWSMPMKKMFELDRKIKSSEAAGDDPVMKWHQEEWSANAAQLEKVRIVIEQKSGKPEEVFYQLREMETKYDVLVQESNRLEELSTERAMLVETIESALTSPEMQFDVNIGAEDRANPKSAILLKAWRPGEEMLEMRFDLDKRENIIDAFATGFAGPGYPSGCDSAFGTLAKQLESRGLKIKTFQDGEELPTMAAYQVHPGLTQEHTGGR
jgi:hypothetical protein